MNCRSNPIYNDSSHEGDPSHGRDQPRPDLTSTLPTSRGKVPTKKELIVKYHVNSPQMTAFEIAEKLKTSPSYVWKVLSEVRKPGKVERGGYGRIFGHGKVWYEWWVPRGWLAVLNAPMVNRRTGMRQVGFKGRGDPCSCQIHVSGRLVIWVRSNGWRDWLVEELSACGWSRENARVMVDHAQLSVNVVEGGVKPGDPGFLPKDLYLETDWGFVICKDDSPERSVLELKLRIPNMQRYLGIPEIRKQLEVLERGSLTVAQRVRALEVVILQLCRILYGEGRRSSGSTPATDRRDRGEP